MTRTALALAAALLAASCGQGTPPAADPAPASPVPTNGYRPFGDPAELLGPDGQVVAVEGARLELGGGFDARPTEGLCRDGHETLFHVGPIEPGYDPAPR